MSSRTDCLRAFSGDNTKVPYKDIILDFAVMQKFCIGSSTFRQIWSKKYDL